MQTKEQHIISVAQDIQELQAELRINRDMIGKFAVDAASKKGEYEKELAKTLLRLSSGVISEFEGYPIPERLSASERERIARGLCYESRVKSELANLCYTGLLAKVRAIQSELNGSQSIYRHLDET